MAYIIVTTIKAGCKGSLESREAREVLGIRGLNKKNLNFSKVKFAKLA